MAKTQNGNVAGVNAQASPRSGRHFGWYSELTRRERLTYWACFGGLGLDALDTTIYALVMPTLIAILGITTPQAGMIASAALIGSAVGGWIAGIAADRVGRIRVLQITILLVAGFTFLSAFTHSYWQLLATRTIQGLGYGGEAAVGGVLISETIAPRLRGRVAASVQSGYAVGYAVSTAVMPVIFALFSQAMAWRVFFCIGLAPALFVMFLRRFVPDSDIYIETKRRETPHDKVNTRGAWEIFVPPHLKNTVTATVLSFGIFGGAYVLITWLPTYLRTVLGLRVSSTAGYLALNILGSFVGPFLYGYLSDGIGRRRSSIIFLYCQAVNVAIYMFAPIHAGITLLLGFSLGALQGGLASGMLMSFSELFPTRIRATGQGFTLSAGRGLAAVVPGFVGLLTASLPLGRAMGICGLSSYCVALAAAYRLREMKGADLREPAAKP
jgi:MFS family permease